MNYQRIHDQIIDRAKSRVLNKNEYKERHHIIPKSMGGSDDRSNLVDLTAREHFIIHGLLYKIHKTPNMAYAWNMMCTINDKQSRYNSHLYKLARKAAAKAQSERIVSEETREKFRNYRHNEESRKKISLAKKGKILGTFPLKPEYQLLLDTAISNHPPKNEIISTKIKVHSEAQLKGYKKTAQKLTGRSLTEEHKRNVSLNNHSSIKWTINFNNETYTITDNINNWAKEFGLSHNVLFDALKRTNPIEIYKDKSSTVSGIIKRGKFKGLLVTRSPLPA